MCLQQLQKKRSPTVVGLVQSGLHRSTQGQSAVVGEVLTCSPPLCDLTAQLPLVIVSAVRHQSLQLKLR